MSTYGATQARSLEEQMLRRKTEALIIREYPAEESIAEDGRCKCCGVSLTARGACPHCQPYPRLSSRARVNFMRRFTGRS